MRRVRGSRDTVLIAIAGERAGLVLGYHRVPSPRLARHRPQSRIQNACGLEGHPDFRVRQRYSDVRGQLVQLAAHMTDAVSLARVLLEPREDDTRKSAVVPDCALVIPHDFGEQFTKGGRG